MPNDKKAASWLDIRKKANDFYPGGMERPDVDPEYRGDNLKEIGYPGGLPGIYKDGRFLRNIDSGCHVFANAFGAGIQTVGGLQIQVHGQSRALLLDWIVINAVLVNVDIVIEWQIWSDGRRIANGTHTNSYQPLDLYFPPYSNETFYMRVTNSTVAPPLSINVNVSLRWIEFDSEGDKYKFEKGTNAANPPIGTIVWPGFFV